MKIISPTRFTAVAKICLNGQDIAVSGGGEINQPTGSVMGRYDVSDMPENIDPRVLKTVMITGYPSVCAKSEDRQSPFIYGDYTYHRELDFGDDGYLSYDADCKFVERDSEDGPLLVSTFTGKGELPDLELENCEGVTELWIPDGENIKGRFDVAFRRRGEDKWFVGEAHTTYKFSEAPEIMSGITHRHIVFPFADVSNGELKLRQDSTLI